MKFEFDKNAIEQKIKEAARQKVSTQPHNVNCPHCNAFISIPQGKHPCPFCGKEINLTLDINF